MRRYPTDKYEHEEAKRLDPAPWMLAELKRNPSYVSWGPHEDYMWNEKDGWDSRIIAKSWPEFDIKQLNELNEVVNFYFCIEREGKPCETCNGKGRHTDAQWITESFYHHSSPFTQPDSQENAAKATLERFGCVFTDSVHGRGSMPDVATLERYGKPFMEFCVRTMERGGCWSDDITEDEAEALVKSGRGTIDGLKTAEDFNRANRPGARGFGHDAINAWILFKQRCQRLGVPLECHSCEGHGSHFVASARLDLVLWVLHPRKGCSRGVQIENIEKHELPEVYAYLREAARRNAKRFSKIPRNSSKA